MYRLTLLLSLSLVCLTPTIPASAEEAPAEEQDATVDDTEASSEAFDQDHRRSLYEANRLDGWRAVAYTAAFPGLGNFYVEQYALGVVAMSAMVFAGMFIGFGAMYGHSDLIGIGAVTAGSAYLGGGISSYLGTRSYNNRLRRNLHIDDDHNASVPRSPSVGIGWSWSF